MNRVSAPEPLVDSSGLLGHDLALRCQFGELGYLLIRGLLPAAEATALAVAVRGVARQAGWLTTDDTGREVVAQDQACWEGQAPFHAVHRVAWSLEAFHRLPHDPSLLRVIRSLLQDEDVVVHPRKVLRLVFPSPHRAGGPKWHQDYPEIQGTTDTLTVWTPLEQADIETGVLAVLPGSHQDGLLPLLLANGPAGWTADTGVKERRVSAGLLEPGDVLIFGALTLHGAMPHLGDQLRISVDCRFQRRAEPINETTLDLVSEPYSWDDVYRDWEADDLKYYWQALPLNVVPYDRSWDDWRETAALEAGSRLDPEARSALDIVSRFGSRRAHREEATALLSKMDAVG